MLLLLNYSKYFFWKSASKFLSSQLFISYIIHSYDIVFVIGSLFLKQEVSYNVKSVSNPYIFSSVSLFILTTNVKLLGRNKKF